MITPQTDDKLKKSLIAIQAWFNDYEILNINDARLIADDYGALGYLRRHPNNTYQFVLYNAKLQTIFAITELMFVADEMDGNADEKNLHCLIIKRLNYDYGYIRVNPATLGESLENIIQYGDLNFAHYPKFEEMYTVKVEKPIKATRFFTADRITLFEKVGDLRLLINKNTLLSRISNCDAHGDWVHLLNMAAHID